MLERDLALKSSTGLGANRIEAVDNRVFGTPVTSYRRVNGF